MEILNLFTIALFDLSNAMAPYILFGLLFAGVLHEIVPDDFVLKHLGNNSIISVIKSTLFGIPLPVCSCGVIPLAVSLKENGASNGATISFLISTPITGADSMMATYGIFGLPFTIYRVITSLVIAIVAGVITNIFVPTKSKALTPKFSSSKCSSGGSCCSGKQKEIKKSFSIKRAFTYGYFTLLKDIAKPLLWGLILGALITVAIPSNLSQFISDNLWLSYLIAIIVAVPMYVCATSSLPIAAGLILSGVSVGASFVFLTAGPATNSVTMGVVAKMLGRTSLWIYLSSIIIGSILFGIAMDILFASIDIDVKSLISMDSQAGFIAIGSSIILWLSIFYFIIMDFSRK